MRTFTWAVFIATVLMPVFHVYMAVSGHTPVLISALLVVINVAAAIVLWTILRRSGGAS